MSNSKELEAGKWSNKGESLYHEDQFQEALRCYDKATTLDPSNAKIWLNKGHCHKADGDFNEAHRCYDKAIEVDPGYAEAWLSKGIMCGLAWRQDEALRCATKAVQLDPNNAYAWYAKGFGERDLGRLKDAAHSFRRFIALAPPEWSHLIERARDFANDS